MSGIKKGFKKIGKKIANFGKKYWKEIAIAALVVFTAGIATVGVGAYAAAASGGIGSFFSATASTMWAGATSIAGTVGIGSGASGSVAAGAGMEGATLLTGAGAQSLGLAASGAGTAGGGAVGATGANVGMYTGPGSSFMGGSGSLFGGGAEKWAAKNTPGALQAFQGGTAQASPVATNQPLSTAVNQQLGGGAQSPLMQSGVQNQARNQAVQGLTGMKSNRLGEEAVKQASGGFMRDVGKAAVPSLITAGGQMLMAQGQQQMYEDQQPQAMWGVNIDEDSDDYLTAYDPFENVQPHEFGPMQARGPRNPYNPYNPAGGVPGPAAPIPNYGGLLNG